LRTGRPLKKKRRGLNFTYSTSEMRGSHVLSLIIVHNGPGLAKRFSNKSTLINFLKRQKKLMKIVITNVLRNRLKAKLKGFFILIFSTSDFCLTDFKDPQSGKRMHLVKFEHQATCFGERNEDKQKFWSQTAGNCPPRDAFGLKWGVPVAVYIEADSWRAVCDENRCVAPSGQSYLQGGKIIEACRQTRAQAIHPNTVFFVSEGMPLCPGGQAGRYLWPFSRFYSTMGSKLAAKRPPSRYNARWFPGSPEAVTMEAKSVAVPSVSSP